MKYRYTSWDSVEGKDCYECTFEANSPREAIENGLELLQEEMLNVILRAQKIVLTGEDIPDIYLWRYTLGDNGLSAQRDRIRKAFPQYFEGVN